MKLFKRLLFLSILCCFCLNTLAQNDSLAHRKKLLAYTFGGTYVASVVGFHQLWYKNHDRGSFQFFNDNDEWLLMDKIGHGFSAYALAKYTSKSYEWAGVEKKKAALYGGITSMVFLTTIEVFDGFSSNWGFSWGDMAANLGGTALGLGQKQLWGKEIIKLKYSYSPSDYRKVRPEILGNNELEAIFKDYNGQTYWASINLNAISQKVKPKWLSLALGYGGDKMLRGNGTYYDSKGNVYHPERAYYLSLDIDLEKINTRKAWLKSVLSVLNIIKVPFPSVEFREGGKAKFHYLYF